MEPPIANPFRSPAAAVLYRRARPDHHPTAIAIIRDLLGEGALSTRALDVGCGTGLSTAALGAIATLVVGMDSAPAMVAVAATDTGLPCVVALGEHAPFRAGAFGGVTVSSALHWLDRARFFAECRRLLRSGGWLAIYDHFFAGIEGAPEFMEWVGDTYLARYPIPFHGEGFGPKSDVPAGFRRVGDRNYEDPRTLTRSEVVDYHLSQSFVLAALEERGEHVDAIRDWLDAELRRFVPDGKTVTVRFVGTVGVLEAVEAE